MKVYEKHYFDYNFIKKNLNNRKVFVVFSTFGDRESKLIFHKINLIKNHFSNMPLKIILSHRRIDSNITEITELKAMEANDDCKVLVCNHYNITDMGNEGGKGADMRRTLHYINTKMNADSNDIIIYLDSDVKEKYFGEHFVINLLGAILDGNDFAKAGFWREMGRVKKYLAQPLFSSISHPNLELLSNFSYPLSGEVAGTIKFFNSIHFWQIYGIETGMNIDAAFNNYKCADVNLGQYDHEHSSDENIQKMSFAIVRTYLKQLESYGLIEFKNGASISNNFKMTSIKENQSRVVKNYDLDEIKYNPLNKILQLKSKS